ncbi:RNA polymerase sigma factor [Paraglaciecola aestuariivivens]
MDAKTRHVEPQDLDSFLLSIEQKAYRMTLMSVGQHADAIDILQDSMFKLAVKYAHKPAEQWKPLFYRILQNRIKDWHRQQKIKNWVFFWKSSDQMDEEGETLVSQIPEQQNLPDEDLMNSQQQHTALQQLADLSDKQRQCFLLRSWEGLSVTETAQIMGCSPGSVKTHYFRAVNKLRAVMEETHDIKI